MDPCKTLVCGHCASKHDLSYCSGCGVQAYCGASCQKAHWNDHALYCQQISRSRADVRAVPLVKPFQVNPKSGLRQPTRKEKQTLDSLVKQFGADVERAQEENNRVIEALEKDIDSGKFRTPDDLMEGMLAAYSVRNRIAAANRARGDALLRRVLFQLGGTTEQVQFVEQQLFLVGKFAGDLAGNGFSKMAASDDTYGKISRAYDKAWLVIHTITGTPHKFADQEALNGTMELMSMDYLLKTSQMRMKVADEKDFYTGDTGAVWDPVKNEPIKRKKQKKRRGRKDCDSEVVGDELLSNIAEIKGLFGTVRNFFRESTGASRITGSQEARFWAECFAKFGGVNAKVPTPLGMKNNAGVDEWRKAMEDAQGFNLWKRSMAGLADTAYRIQNRLDDLEGTLNTHEHANMYAAAFALITATAMGIYYTKYVETKPDFRQKIIDTDAAQKSEEERFNNLKSQAAEATEKLEELKAVYLQSKDKKNVLESQLLNPERYMAAIYAQRAEEQHLPLPATWVALLDDKTRRRLGYDEVPVPSNELAAATVTREYLPNGTPQLADVSTEEMMNDNRELATETGGDVVYQNTVRTSPMASNTLVYGKGNVNNARDVDIRIDGKSVSYAEVQQQLIVETIYKPEFASLFKILGDELREDAALKDNEMAQAFAKETQEKIDLLHDAYERRDVDLLTNRLSTFYAITSRWIGSGLRKLPQNHKIIDEAMAIESDFMKASTEEQRAAHLLDVEAKGVHTKTLEELRESQRKLQAQLESAPKNPVRALGRDIKFLMNIPYVTKWFYDLFMDPNLGSYWEGVEQAVSETVDAYGVSWTEFFSLGAKLMQNFLTFLIALGALFYVLQYVVPYLILFMKRILQAVVAAAHWVGISKSKEDYPYATKNYQHVEEANKRVSFYAFAFDAPAYVAMTVGCAGGGILPPIIAVTQMIFQGLSIVASFASFNIASTCAAVVQFCVAGVGFAQSTNILQMTGLNYWRCTLKVRQLSSAAMLIGQGIYSVFGMETSLMPDPAGASMFANTLKSIPNKDLFTTANMSNWSYLALGGVMAANFLCPKAKRALRWARGIEGENENQVKHAEGASVWETSNKPRFSGGYFSNMEFPEDESDDSYDPGVMEEEDDPGVMEEEEEEDDRYAFAEEY